MKQGLAFLTAIIILISGCSNADETDSLTADGLKQAGKGEKSSTRQQLINELAKMKAMLATKSPASIAGIFEFPLADTTAAIWTDDSAFNAQYEKNLNKTTREMFLQHYPEVSAALEIEHVDELFKAVDLKKLLQQDTITHQVIIRKDPCYRFYEIRAEKDLVTLAVGSASNENYKDTAATKDEVPANSSEMCEHIIWWVFKFDGTKLILKNISAAG